MEQIRLVVYFIPDMQGLPLALFAVLLLLSMKHPVFPLPFIYLNGNWPVWRTAFYGHTRLLDKRHEAKGIFPVL